MSYIIGRSDKSVILKLYVQPKAAKDRLVGLHDGCLKIAVAAPPVDGKANKKVLKFLATILGIPASDLSLRSGAQSRRKQVKVKSLDASSVRKRLAKSLVDP